jgi:paired amphipathic helix protein Sin3a
MLPPSLSNKLPSQGGIINNEVQDGVTGSSPTGNGSIMGGNAFASAAVNSSNTSGTAPGNGIDNDVVMSDAHPSPTAPHDPSFNGSDSIKATGVLDQSKIEHTSILQPEQPPQAQEHEKVQMMDTTEDGSAGQNGNTPHGIPFQQTIASVASASTVPSLEKPADPPNDSKTTAVVATTTTPIAAMEVETKEAPKQSPIANAIEEKKTPAVSTQPPANAADAAAHFLGGSSSATLALSTVASVKKENTASPPVAQPLQGPGFQLGGGTPSGAMASSASRSPGKAADNSPVAAQPIVATKPIIPVQGFTAKPSEPSNGTETIAAAKPNQHIPLGAMTNSLPTGGIMPSQNNPSPPGAAKLAQPTKPQRHPILGNNVQQPSVSTMPVMVSKPKPPATATMVGATMNKDNSTAGLPTGASSGPNTSKLGMGNATGVSMMGNANLNGGQPVPPPPPPPQPPRPPQGGQMMGGMRELRVEDALLYLDDVKREFGGRPRVYNEFLAIMKNFKSQEVDTPGVIQRVSKLFRGNNHLILGFNKFLPDGYKISMEDLKKMDAQHEREQELLRQQQAVVLEKAQQQQAEARIRLPQQRLAAEQQHQLQQNQGLQQPPQQLPMLQAQIQDVPMRDVQEPPVQALGQPMLLATDLQEQHRQQQAKPPKQSKKSKVSKKQQQQQAQQQPVPPQQPPQQPTQQPPQMQHQAVEFDHAISYVTTIKRRFANDQSTYHSFLEILHTYQKEQRGIKEVLEQVAHLFQDHPDLLKEFTFFLPDAVQEQAKERLHRAAAESESRLSALKNSKNIPVQGSSKEVIDMTDHTRAMVADQGEARGQKRYKDAQQTPILITYPQAPETFVYNSAVERQFFDAAKEALASYTRDGGQAWAEFMKCLDMYAQEILSKSEMLNLVEPLLGKRNNKLFEEFKRILSAAGGQGMSAVPSMEDSWYSVPLSEIDFSRCRKCGPSYRALPRDYPAPPCSQRNDEEAKVLNDVWVSLPVGSEESYTFRHMRRNTYEETLFRVEDERFEIDMTIDSNMCTLALLEPFAEEMAQLSGENFVHSDKENDTKAKAEGKGLGGKHFRFTFDPNILGVIHRNSITRIYGDAGPQMLELLKNNPSVAIPIVVRRLRQKDIEFRAARDYLNRHWREMAQSNYYKSLDHRGLTFRTTDKRAISNRTFLNDIKDRAANNGNESAAALQARIDKAKEEHGSFFETTMAKSNEFLKKLDLSKLPKPDRRLFTPDLSLMYENNSCIQKDVYRILSFALERGSISPTDKERCHRLWTEFLGPWFNLKLDWMLEPAVAFQETTTAVSRLPRVVSQDDNSQDDEDDTPDEDGEIKARIVTEEMRDDGNDGLDTPLNVDHHPLPTGATVSTIYGEGCIIGCRKQDDMYVVRLKFGTATVRPSAVLCSVLDAEKSAYTTHRMVDDHTKLERPNDKLIIGTQSLFLFFRLHEILCRRVGIARKLAYEVHNTPSLQTLVEPMPGQYGTAAGKRRYEAFLSLVYALLDGGTGGASEGGKFEDRVRTLLGHWGYELATMDKLISHILKNIQSMANDDTMWSLVQLFRRHIDAGGFKPEALRQEAAYLSEGEPMYAFQYCPIQKDRGEKAVLHVESLGVIVGSEEEDSLSDRVVEPSTKRQRR